MYQKHGHLNVNHKGEAEILIPWKPKEAEVYFIDSPCPPPSPGCAPLPDPDEVTCEIKELTAHTWVLFIKWSVTQPRKVEWKVFRQFF